jgi:hypothetical protein
LLRLATVVALLILPVSCETVPPTSSIPPDARTVKRMEKILLPRLVFSDVPVREAAEIPSTASREADPEGRGVKIDVMPTGTSGIRVNLNLVNVPLPQAVKFFAMTTGLRYRIEPDRVVFGTKKALGIVKLPPEMLKPVEVTKWWGNPLKYLREPDLRPLARKPSTECYRAIMTQDFGGRFYQQSYRLEVSPDGSGVLWVKFRERKPMAKQDSGLAVEKILVNANAVNEFKHVLGDLDHRNVTPHSHPALEMFFDASVWALEITRDGRYDAIERICPFYRYSSRNLDRLQEFVREMGYKPEDGADVGKHLAVNQRFAAVVQCLQEMAEKARVEQENRR